MNQALPVADSVVVGDSLRRRALFCLISRRRFQVMAAAHSRRARYRLTAVWGGDPQTLGATRALITPGHLRLNNALLAGLWRE